MLEQTKSKVEADKKQLGKNRIQLQQQRERVGLE
jgi:hypothetical protein